MKLLWICFLILLATHSHGQKYTTPIKHFVVVMLENRSFDHMLGHLQGINSQVRGLNETEWNPIDPTKSSSPRVYVDFKAPDTFPDPGHSILDTEEQIYGKVYGSKYGRPKMNGFIANAFNHMDKEWAPRIMQNYRHETAPILSTLAQEFALFDMWFSSVPGPTQPNRMFLHSCTSGGLGYNDILKMLLGLPQKTIYQSLEEAGHKWRIYFEEFTEVLILKRMRNSSYVDNYRWFNQFKEDVANGDLPSFSLINPSYYGILNGPAKDQHPDHSVVEGEKFLKDIYETLRQSDLWNSTALLITYDEHGGFFDHVPPPTRVPSPDGLNSENPHFNFTRLGVRVPTILVSPWVKKEVIHEPIGQSPFSQFEHSSIHATLKKLFNLDSFLTRRDAWAGTFEYLFSKTIRTDTPLTLPPVPEHFKVEKEIPEHLQPLNGLQEELLVIAEAAAGVQVSQRHKIQTKQEGSEYIRALMEQFLKKSREELNSM